MSVSRPTRRAMLVLLPLITAGAVRADDGERRRDHDDARAALAQGRIRSLADILDTLGDRLGGELIEVELERDDGRYVYELTVLSAGGRVRELKVDAASATILEVEDD